MKNKPSGVKTKSMAYVWPAASASKADDNLSSGGLQLVAKMAAGRRWHRKVNGESWWALCAKPKAKKIISPRRK